MGKIALIGAAAALTSGLLSVRAEATPKPPVTIDTLVAGFEAFKAAHKEELTAMRADIVTTEKVDRINADLTTMQETIDQQAAIIAAAQLGNGAVVGDIHADPEYTTAFKAHMRQGDRTSPEIEATLSKGTDADGGFTAPIEWDRTITNKLTELNPLRAHARVISISSAGFKKLFNLGGTGSGWVGETAARPETSTPTFGSLQFDTGELYANPAISQQLLDDSAIDLEAWLADEVQGEFAKQEGIAFLSGNGTNKPFGILNYVTGAANAAKHPFGAIKAINSGHASQLTADGILDLINDLPAEFAPNAKLFLNRQTIGGVRKLKDGQGNYLWQPSYALGTPQTLAGESVVTLPGMPAVAANAIAALYGDMDATYLIIDRIGIRVLRDPYTNKPFVHFYTTKRVGGGVHNPEPMRALKVAAAA